MEVAKFYRSKFRNCLDASEMHTLAVNEQRAVGWASCLAAHRHMMTGKMHKMPTPRDHGKATVLLKEIQPDEVASLTLSINLKRRNRELHDIVGGEFPFMDR